MEYLKLNLGGCHYLSSRCRAYLGATTPLYPAVEILGRYMKRNSWTVTTPPRATLLPHLFRKTWASLPTPGAVGIPGQAHKYMWEDLTIISGRPHYPTLRYRNTWASLAHLALTWEAIGIPDSHYAPSVTGMLER